MKINDERRRLAVESVQAEPAFLHTQVTPCADGSKETGL